MAVTFLTVVMNDASKYMERLMIEQCRHIDQLVGQRVASLYLKELKEHVSRIEALMLQHERINGDKAPTVTMEKVPSAWAAATICYW